jgi:PRC-barrel domain
LLFVWRMGNEVNTEEAGALRYLDATAVECSAGTLEGLSLFSRDDEALGVINGVLINPRTRQLKYFVVHRERMLNRRRYLVSAEMPAVVLPEDRGLRVDVPSDSVERQRFDARAVSRFSDDDLLTALFAPHHG